MEILESFISNSSKFFSLIKSLWYPNGPESDFLYYSAQEVQKATSEIVPWMERENK